MEAASRTTPSPEPGLAALVDAVEGVFHGKREVVEMALAALLARGHILFEDVPGVGKTTLARALAAALGLEFRRVQFTSDLLPSDVVGVSVYNPDTRNFETRPGPIFCNVLLGDEINRAPPRTQSGLLEAMQEGRVTIGDETYELPHPFLVLATQNPLEHHGTYPLPESQLDRFLMRLEIGYPDMDAERKILLESAGSTDQIARIRPVLSRERIFELQEAAERVHAEASMVDYLMRIVRATREDARLRLGASPRGAVALFRAARALALVEGRNFLAPDDVRRLVVPCLAHRLIAQGTNAATPDAHSAAAEVLEEIAARIPVPV